jgi:hypothetical protein
MQVAIYALCEPDGEIRYIGKAQHPRNRLEAHLSEARAGAGGHRCNWLRSLLERGERPLLTVLDRIPEAEWREWERTWIACFREAGCRLVNDTDGGEGRVGPLSAETRAKLSAAHKGRPVNQRGSRLSEEHRRKIAESLRGNQRVAGKTWKLSEEAKENIRRGRWGDRKAAAASS